MAKGGARVRSGPAPDPNALARERDAKDWLRLPAGPVELEVPEWPLSRPATDAEAALWLELWALPESLIWRRQSSFRQVGLYVRTTIRAEDPDATAAILAQARQLGEALLLTDATKRAARVEIVAAVAATAPIGRSAGANRERLKVLRGGDSA